jgi:hypothetical protein
MRRVFALLFALLVVGSHARAQTDRFALAEFELTGPITALEVSAGDSAHGALAAKLSAGERLRVELALPVEAPSAAEAPAKVRVVGDGTARFVGWKRDAATSREQAWSRVPMALRMRPRASPATPSERRVPNAALWIAAAGALLAIGARTRAWAALACGAATALVVGWLTHAQGPRPTRIRLVEFDGPSGRAVAVDSARERLSGADEGDLRWESTPAHAPLRATARRDRSGYELSASGAVLRSWTSFEIGARALSADENRLGLLAPVWRRDAAGDWSAAGSWAVGDAWPNDTTVAEAGSEEPPGWLQPALPLGVRVLVGRWRSATPAESGGAGEVWVRWVGP